MFPQFKKINNESGIVLFLVLMVAIVIMIFSAGILTQSMNEINYAQLQIDQINAQENTMGQFSNSYTTYIAQGNPCVGATSNTTSATSALTNCTYSSLYTPPS